MSMTCITQVKNIPNIPILTKADVMVRAFESSNPSTKLCNMISPTMIKQPDIISEIMNSIHYTS